MSKKLLRGVGKAAMIVGAIAAIGTGIGAALGGTMMLTVFGTSIAASTIAGAASAISVGASLLTKPKAAKISTANEGRLNASVNVRRSRVIAFGRTALDTDLRDQEYTGAGKEYLHRFFVNAAHRINAHQEIWFDDQLAWTAAGGAQGKFAGYLTVTAIAEGGPANAINISPRMGATRRYTGCAYVYMRFKLTGNGRKAESPFSQQVPTRITIVGEAIPCYDARQDSSRGGSGTHRANDQATWTFGEHARNPACQYGTYLLGWRIQNPQSLTWKLSVGCGTPPDRIDWPSFIEAANLCDEPVTLAAGGTEPRYRGDGLFDEEDDPTTVTEAFKACMNADVDDQDGLIRLTVFHNDLATPDADFTEADVQDDYQWRQTIPLHESFNVVRGSYIEPDPKSLYQPNDYKEPALPPPDGIERAHTADFGLVQSRSQAERLAKQLLQRQQYGGTFSATFLAPGWKVHKNSVVRLSFAPEGWTGKLFRVAEVEVREDGLVPMVLREENAAIYAWAAEESPAVQIAEPTLYDPLDSPVVQAIGDAGTTADWPSVANRPANLAALVGDEAIENSLIAERIFADNILSAAEKQGGFARLYADLESRFADLKARADALALSTAALTTARTAWQDMLAGFAPAWNDTSADTTIYTHLFADRNFPAGWTLSFATTAANGVYTTVTDADTVNYGQISRSAAQAGVNTYSAGLLVKKDAVGKATRAPRLDIYTGGGTFKRGVVYLDTSTGEALSAQSADAGGALDLGDEWLLWATLTTNADNTSVTARLYPAVGQNFTASAATTGSVDVRSPLIVLGDWKKLGREMLKARQFAYSAQMTKLAKAISEEDARRAEWATVGSRPTELTDGRVAAGLDATGDLARNITPTRRDLSGLLGRTGGGVFTGDLTATEGAYFGGNLRETLGGVVATVPNYRTADGIAAGFTGQGALAVKNAVDLATADVLNKSLANVDATANTKLGGIEAGATVGATWGTNAYGFGGLAGKELVKLGAGGEVYREDGVARLTDALVVTSLGTAAAIANQTAWATYGGLVPANVAGQVQFLDTGGNLSGLDKVANRRLTLLQRADGATALTEPMVVTSQGGGFDNIVPDPDIRDPSFWNFPAGAGGVDTDPTWEMARAVNLDGLRDFDFSSDYFNIEVGATYRVRTRIWNNGAGPVTGALWPLIHIPTDRWFSLKHGAAVDPTLADAANAIVAAGDTGHIDHYFRTTLAAARKIQFRFKSTMRGTDISVIVSIQKVTQLDRDLMRPASAAKYAAAEIETGLGIAAGFTGQGALATKNAVDFATAEVLNRNLDNIADSASYVRYQPTERTKLTDVEATADVTGSVTGAASITIKYATDGVTALSGELPRDTAYKHVRNGADVTTASGWAVAVRSGTIACTVGAANGVLNITGLSTAEAVVRLTATYGGKARVLDVTVRKDVAAPTPSGTANASDNSFANTTATTHAAISDELTITLLSSVTQARLIASLNPKNVSAGAGTYPVFGKAQWWDGAAWVDVNAEVWSDPHAANSVDAETGMVFRQAGTLAFNVLKTGLTAGSTHKFRFMARNDGFTASMGYSGSVEAKGDGT